MNDEQRLKTRRKEFLSQFMKNNKLCFWLIMLLSMVISVYSLAISWILQKIIDAASEKNMQDIVNTVVLYVVTFALVCVVCWLHRVCYTRFLKKGTEQYKRYAFSQIMRKQYGAFFRERTEKYISAFTNDVNTIEKKYLVAMFGVFNMVVRLIGALIMMVAYSPLFTLIAIIFSLLPMLVSAKVGDGLIRKEQSVSRKNESFVGVLKDLLTGFNLIKSFKAENEAMALFDASNEVLETEKCDKRKKEESINFMGMIAGNTVQIGVFFVGACFCVYGDQITPGVVLAFTQLMNYIILPIKQIPLIFANWKSAISLVDRAIQNIDNNVVELGRECIAKKLEQGIIIENLCYEHESNKELFHNLNMSFEVGKSYAIVGDSGSGKSTILNLLMGMTKKYEGSIFFDHKELRDINQDALYDSMALVQQNVFVFNDTIRNNITMFREYSDIEVNKAIKKAGLEVLIQERGENYICGENGCNLSGGERQRIALARAMLQEKSIMLFDEVTAALDADTAYSISKTIMEMQDVTKIVVTHSLDEDLLANYDEIYVIKNGAVVERGSYNELMWMKGVLHTWLRGSKKSAA